jgi:16S rRNA (uracil1498-N3)-methyltransferase
MMNNRGMLPRFFVGDLDRARGTATLAGEEAHHAARVLRLREGDEVALFDGMGREWTGRIARLDRGGVTVDRLTAATPVPEPGVPFVLAQAVLKGDAMDDAIRDATMMGAAGVQPLITAHTAVKPALAARPATTERWRRVALASAKQCRRATLPEVGDARPFRAWLDADDGAALKLMFVEPTAGIGARSLRTFVGSPAPDRVRLLVGPEGGWAQDEVEAATARGWIPVTLGTLTLRADAVPIAAIAIVRFLWDL